jgi:predicted phosphodiesterase
MTRLAVLADIHGNLPALEAVIADMAQFEVDQVIVAGDSINWGPYSAEVLERIYAENWAVIRGNHEFYMLYRNTPFMPEAWRGFTTLDWLNSHIPKKWRTIVSCQPDELRLCFNDAPFVRVVHGTPGNHWKGIYPTQSSEDEIHTMLGGVEENTVIGAHTHLALERRVGRWHILNPGSVGVPLDGILGARYLILDGSTEGWKANFRHLEYDIAPLIEECERQDYISIHGVTGRLMIEEFKTARPQIHPFAQWRRKYHPGEPESFELLEQFFKLGDAVLEFRLPDYRVNLNPVVD